MKMTMMRKKTKQYWQEKVDWLFKLTTRAEKKPNKTKQKKKAKRKKQKKTKNSADVDDKQNSWNEKMDGRWGTWLSSSHLTTATPHFL